LRRRKLGMILKGYKVSVIQDEKVRPMGEYSAELPILHYTLKNC
jgi:hypothetical protein